MRFKTKCNIVAGSDAFSIVEVVIGIGMLGLAVVAALGLMRNYTSTIAEVKMRGENFDLRQYIRKSLDCNESLRTPTSINPDASIAAGCLAPGGASLEILTADGVTTLIRENPDGPETDLSFKTKTKLRAKCQGVGGDIGIFVEFVPWRRTGPSTGSVAPDPITGKPQVWTSISEKIPFLCSYDDSVSRTYTGGCVGVRHGGSAAAADAMNRSYLPQYEAICKLSFDLSKDFGTVAVGKTKIEVSFTNGTLPKIGSTYPDGATPFTDPSLQCSGIQDPTGLFGVKTANITMLEKAYTDSKQVIGSHDKGGEWAIDFDPATKVLTITGVSNGWGKCRYTGQCGTCIQGASVKLLSN